MKKMIVLSIVLLNVFLLSSFSSAENKKSPFELIITTNGPIRKWEKEHFHVLLKNISNEPQKIWDPGCPAGFYSLSFEIVGLNAEKKNFSRSLVPPGNVGWSVTIIPAGAYYVFDIDPFGAEWRGFLTLGMDSFSVKAIFEEKLKNPYNYRGIFQHGVYPEDSGVWEGRVESDISHLSLVSEDRSP